MIFALFFCGVAGRAIDDKSREKILEHEVCEHIDALDKVLIEPCVRRKACKERRCGREYYVEQSHEEH